MILTKMKELRAEARMTQGELAYKAGVAVRTIQHAEMGISVSLGTAKKLEKALKVKPGGLE